MAKKFIPPKNVPLAEVIERRVMMSVAPHAAAARLQPKAAVQPATIVDPVGGLTGTYYRGANFQQEVMSRNDANINFLWGQGAPDAALVHKRFSVRWTGQITAQYSENYTFTTVADDGVRVWVGGKLIINDWKDQFATVARGTVTLEAGQTYDIRIDYYENGDPPAAIRLYWQRHSQPQQIVPTDALHTNPTPGSVGSPSLGDGIPSNPPTPPATPAAAANLAATATGISTIHLSWSDVTGETGFVVQRSPDGQTGWTGVATISAGQTAFDDTGLASGTTYFYRIIATNAAGPSGASNVASATTQGVVYGLTNDGKVERIDTTNAATTQVGTLAFGTAAGDTDPTSGKIYYFEQNTSTPRVAVWDPATNTNTTLATISVSGPVMRAAFNKQGMLYITGGNGDLYTVDTTTGAATLLGTIRYNGSPLPAPSGDMAFAADGSLYLDENANLFKVDVNTLAATYVGSNGNIGNVQVAFSTDGLLYGAVGDGSLYRIDLATGAATLVGNTDVYQVGDLAPVWG